MLNRLGWDMCLCPVSCTEGDMALEHLQTFKAGDVVVVDRGYTGFEWLTAMSGRGVHMVARCMNPGQATNTLSR